MTKWYNDDINYRDGLNKGCHNQGQVTCTCQYQGSRDPSQILGSPYFFFLGGAVNPVLPPNTEQLYKL